MAYSLFHIINTSVMENISTLECLKSYIKGEKIFSETEILEMIENTKALNRKLNECSIKVITDINKELF